MYNRITKKKVEMHNTSTRPVTDKLWTEIDTDIAMNIIPEC
jgi:hypothetical protein